MKSVYSTMKLNLNTGRRKTKNVFEDSKKVLQHVDDEIDEFAYKRIYDLLIEKTVKNVNQATDCKAICDIIDLEFPETSAHKLGDAVGWYFRYDDVLRKNIYIQGLYMYIITHTSRIDVLYYALDVFTFLYISEKNPIPDFEIFRVLSSYDPLTVYADKVLESIFEATDKAKTKINWKHVPIKEQMMSNIKVNRDYVNTYLTAEHDPFSLRSRLVKEFKPNSLYSNGNDEDKPYMKIESAQKLISRLYYCDLKDIPGFIEQIDSYFDKYKEGKKNNATTLAMGLLQIQGLDNLHLFKVAMEIFYRTKNCTVMNVSLYLLEQLPYYVYNNAFWTDVEKMVYCVPLAAKAMNLLSKNMNENKFILNIIRLGATNLTHVGLKALVKQSSNPEFKLSKIDSDIILNKSWRRAIRKEECLIQIFPLYRIKQKLLKNEITKKELELFKEYFTILINTESTHNLLEVEEFDKVLYYYIRRCKINAIEIDEIVAASINLLSSITEEKYDELDTFTRTDCVKLIENIKKAYCGN